MRLKAILLTVFTLNASPYSFATDIPNCPNPSLMESTYEPPSIQWQPFKNPLNSLINWLPSYHMVHDQIVAADSEFTVTAKFDYGSIIHKDLEYEEVHFYLRSNDDTTWQFLSSAITNHDGKAFVTLNNLTAGQYRIYAAVPTDGSAAEGYITVIDPNTEAVILDIDGTLTASDSEQIDDYTGIEFADPKEGAYSLARHYIDLGYQPIYLTARVYWYAKGTRAWLDWMGLPEGFLRTSLSNETSLFEAAEYKRKQIEALEAQGIKVISAYGNAKTDAEAFVTAGINPKNIFTIGEHAGYFGTTPILDDRYQQHIEQYVSNLPYANCQQQ